MDATVVAGWIGGLAGLGGAVVGAGASMWATRNGQKHAAEEARLRREHEIADAREQRMFELAKGALDATLIELHSLQKIVDRYYRVIVLPENQFAWREPVEEHLDRISALLHRIPDDHARRRLQRAVLVAQRNDLAGSGYGAMIVWLSVAAREAVECASAHLREQELPPPLDTFVAQDDALANSFRSLNPPTSA
jgi:hypothetical protein